MFSTSRTFEAAAHANLTNDNLQRALGLARTGFPPLVEARGPSGAPYYLLLPRRGSPTSSRTLAAFPRALKLLRDRWQALATNPAQCAMFKENERRAAELRRRPEVTRRGAPEEWRVALRSTRPTN
jgi:hypothetical protein